MNNNFSQEFVNSNFTHLHNHQHYSLLDGFGTAEEYCKRAVELGQVAIANTDHGNLHAIYEFVHTARKYGLTPIPGCEFYVAPENPFGARHKEKVFYGENGEKSDKYDVSGNGTYLHMTIWAYNMTGLSNLMKLSTLSYKEENFYQKPRIDINLLAEYSEGLIASTGCPSSEISTRLLLGQKEKAYDYARRMVEIFGDNYYVEIMNHHMDIDLEKRLLPLQVQLSKDLNIPLLATNDIHYCNADEAISHEELLCSQSGSVMSEPVRNDDDLSKGGKRFAFNGKDYYFKSTEEMKELFPEDKYPGAITNTMKIARQCEDINLPYNPKLKPNASFPQEFDNEIEYYNYQIQEGKRKRYPYLTEEEEKEIDRRIQVDNDSIIASNFVSYMLVVADYMNWAKENTSTRDKNGNIVALGIGVGRGSVGGSMHSFLLGISETDPARFDLIPERFLSAGRGEMYEIEFEDGTIIQKLASDKNYLELEDLDSTKFTFQIENGDEIYIETEEK